MDCIVQHLALYFLDCLTCGSSSAFARVRLLEFKTYRLKPCHPVIECVSRNPKPETQAPRFHRQEVVVTDLPDVTALLDWS